ncbi:MAG TPA: flagellar biosynthesis anti-sigma factor FlgM [Burkholderiaceae bacterium]|nr:flagellar biosynthesis anti-sigma factor FlgM [Burkholderiaceae bacterium]
MTLLARSNISTPQSTEIRISHEIRPEVRVLALRAAVADGRYRIDSQALASKMIAAILHFESAGKH